VTGCIVHLSEVQDALVRCLTAHPVAGGDLPAESLPLIEAYATMIWARVERVDLAELNGATDAQLDAIRRWLPTADSPFKESMGHG